MQIGVFKVARYYHDVNHHRQHKIAHKMRKSIVGVVLIMALVGAVIFADGLLQDNRSQQPSNVTQAVTSVVSPSIEVFASPFFSFQAHEEWEYIANESTEAKYVYRRTTRGLVSADLRIYINSTPRDPQATRILPVTFSDNRLSAGIISQHCKTQFSDTDQSTLGQASLTFLSVNFVCDVDGTNFSVIAGLENGTTTLNLTRSDDTKATYVFYYRDHRANPDSSEFEKIIDTVEIR